MADEYTRAPVADGPAPQSITATTASTVQQEITGLATGALYEFVAAGFAHISLGLVDAVPDATTAHRLITSTPARFYIDPGKATHIKAIRNGSADVIVSFQRVR